MALISQRQVAMLKSAYHISMAYDTRQTPDTRWHLTKGPQNNKMPSRIMNMQNLNRRVFRLFLKMSTDWSHLMEIDRECVPE